MVVLPPHRETGTRARERGFTLRRRDPGSWPLEPALTEAVTGALARVLCQHLASASPSKRVVYSDTRHLG